MPEEMYHAPIEAENGAERGAIVHPNQEESGEKIDVRRRKISAVTIYDVTESELTILEKGTEASVWLNFFIGSISIAVSFLVALLTVDWGSSITITHIVFICITIIMFLSSIICFVFWKKGKGEHTMTVKTIRERTLKDNC